MKTIENRLLNRYQVISFDIFDTLIERSVQDPKDIFFLAANKFFGDEIKAKEFQKNRIEAEKKGRNEKENGEINLNEIYELLKPIYGDQTTALLDMEIKEEIDSCFPKQKILEFYKKCVAANKIIYIISDMYLSSEILAIMLKKCGISEYKKLYVSNEYHCNKRNGELFQQVINENNIEKRNMIHIGDSIKADFIGGIKSGIKSLLISRKNRIKRLRGR